MISRRGFMAGLATLFGRKALPASPITSVTITSAGCGYTSAPLMAGPGWAELSEITRKAFMPRLYAQVLEKSPLQVWLERDGITEEMLEIDSPPVMVTDGINQGASG